MTALQLVLMLILFCYYSTGKDIPRTDSFEHEDDDYNLISSWLVPILVKEMMEAILKSVR